MMGSKNIVEGSGDSDIAQKERKSKEYGRKKKQVDEEREGDGSGLEREGACL